MSLDDALKQLEKEQDKQQQDLVDLEQLHDLSAIEELERELNAIDNESISQTNIIPAANINLDQEMRLDVTAEPITPIKESHDIDLSLEILGNDERVAQATREGFVICLNFNKDSPSEWSEQAGGGWRGMGLGTYYPDKAQAEIMLQKLQSKWPDYPLSIKH